MLELLKFLARQRFVGFEVPDNPQFGSGEATAWFLEKLGQSKRYLEYGTGGSTYAAARLGIDFIAVDSDRYFLESVRNKIRNDGLTKAAGQTFHYADIGLTGHWGHPLGSSHASAGRVEQFRRYSDPPTICRSGGTLPDLVLVDGRFRVACALKALRMLQNERGWTIAIDDYADRPHYNAIADFAEIDCFIAGRIAVLTTPKPISVEALDSAIRRYETVPY